MDSDIPQQILSKRRQKRPFTGWKHSVVLITGASRGVGRAVAKAVAVRGAKVGLIGRSEHDLNTVLQEINGQGVVAPADVGNFSDISHAIEVIVTQLGPIDVLINCAGIGAFGSFSNESIDVIKNIMHTNYFGTTYTMKAILPSMIQRNRGCIVNVASIAGRIGVPFEAAYSASKFAVIGLSEAIQSEVKSQGIQISVILPGPIKTNYFAARGHPYPFKTPAPMEESKIVKVIIATIERGGVEKFIPSWLGFAYMVRILLPSLYRLGVSNMYKRFFK